MNEEIKTEKKQWTKPELIVLVRSKPEEAVLTNCKSALSLLTPIVAGCLLQLVGTCDNIGS